MSAAQGILPTAHPLGCQSAPAHTFLWCLQSIMMGQQFLHAEHGMGLHIGFAVVGSSLVVGSLLVVSAEVFIKPYHAYTQPHAQFIMI